MPTLAKTIAISLSQKVRGRYIYPVGEKDLITINDQVLVTMGHYVSESDTILISDQIQRVSDYQRREEDAVVANDQLGRVLDYRRVEEDSIVIGDQAGVSRGRYRSDSDSVVIGDQASTITQYQRSKGDALTSIETLDRGLNDTLLKVRACGDSLASTDTLRALKDAYRSVEDSIAVNDQFAVSRGRYRTEEDSAAIGDQLDLAVKYQRTEGDPVAIGDQADPIVEYQRVESDSVVIGDHAGASKEKHRFENDSIIIGDQADPIVEYQRVESDSVVIGDQANPIVEYQRVEGDSVVIGDQSVASKEKHRFENDSIIIGDQASLAAQYQRSENDSVVIGDQASPAVQYQRSENDSVVIGDQASPAVQYQRSRGNNLALVETVDRGLNNTLLKVRPHNDLIIPIDSLQVVRHLYRGISNSIVLGDAVSIEADSFWDRLFNAAATDTPEVCWFRDSSFETVDGSGNLSAASCAWASGHNLSQATASKRPFVNTATGQWEFDSSTPESMVADFSTPLASADRTFLVCVNNVATFNDRERIYFHSQTGELILEQNVGAHPYDVIAYYDGAYRKTTDDSTAGDQYIVFGLKAANSGEIRRNGISLISGLAHTNKAIGGTCRLGQLYSDAANYAMNGNIACFAIYTGADFTDTAAIEAIAAEIMGM